ncbi:MAG: glycosyltransferase family 4 protein [Vicinamibacterales bacterium]
MKLAIVIERYGAEVIGGSEQLCRLVAERLAAQHEVEVLTTCARDEETWKNEYAEGADRVRGVTIRRFATARTRDIAAFKRSSDRIYDKPHSRADEMEWLKQQGPWCPALVEYLRRHSRQYDVVVFFIYRSAPTVLGLEIVPKRSVLVATARDEPAIELEIFKDVFGRPAAVCYLTDTERRLVHQTFPTLPALEDVTGIGIDLPQHQPYPRMALPVDDDGSGEDASAASEGGAEDDENSSVEEFPAHLTARGAVFRRRHRLHGPIVLYGGRIEPGKGCEELIEYFGGYAKEGGDATLTLMGVKLMALPEEPFIRFAGLLSDRERLQALEAATVVVCPSPDDSLSLLALEALSVGTPILASARSAAVVEHCVKSNGGLYYADGDEFIECLKLLMGDAQLRAAMGRNGRDYVRRNCRWDVVLGKYERIFAKVRSAR